MINVLTKRVVTLKSSSDWGPNMMLSVFSLLKLLSIWVWKSEKKEGVNMITVIKNWSLNKTKIYYGTEKSLGE